MANENLQDVTEDDVVFEEEIYQEWVNTDPAPAYPLLAQLAAEGFGALLLSFFGFGLALFPTFIGANDPFLTVLGYAIAIVAGMAAVARVSGGHFNPAITLGAAISGRLRWALVLPFVGAQIIGALLGGALIFLLITSIPDVADSVRLFFNTFAAGWGPGVSVASSSLLTAALIEVILVSVVVGVFLAVTAKRGQKPSAPFIIGALLASAYIFALPFTGSRLNPALATVAALFADGPALSQLWLFWVAALFGGALAGLVYTAFSSETLTHEETFALSDEDEFGTYTEGYDDETSADYEAEFDDENDDDFTQ